MTMKIDFMVPTVDGPVAATGYRVWLLVGKTTRPFVLQITGIHDTPSQLTDYASGYKVHDMAPDQLAFQVMRGDFSTPSVAVWRARAQAIIQRLVEKHGEETLLAKMDAVPVLNGKPTLPLAPDPYLR